MASSIGTKLDQRRLSFRVYLESVLVDFEGPNLRFQRGPRYAQVGRGPSGSEHAPAGFFQSGLNQALFLREEFSRELDFDSLDQKKFSVLSHL